jgi:hypothetical protein
VDDRFAVAVLRPAARRVRPEPRSYPAAGPGRCTG